MSKYHIKNAKNGQFHFNLKAGNGQTILSSEMYVTKQSCLNGIDSVKKHSPHEVNYRRLTASNGQDYFNLLASNHQVIGTSEMYNSASARDNGIESVKENGPHGDIDDES
jgi:uncharacterized protein YegP (UPF0339 family)